MKIFFIQCIPPDSYVMRFFGKFVNAQIKTTKFENYSGYLRFLKFLSYTKFLFIQHIRSRVHIPGRKLFQELVCRNTIIL